MYGKRVLAKEWVGDWSTMRDGHKLVLLKYSVVDDKRALLIESTSIDNVWVVVKFGNSVYSIVQACPHLQKEYVVVVVAGWTSRAGGLRGSGGGLCAKTCAKIADLNSLI